MTKIAYVAWDNWKKFGYDSRFLDSFSALLHFQGDCAAALEFGSNIYLSYNADVTTATSKRIGFFKHMLYTPDFFNEQNLLGLYLVYNIEFKNKIKKSRNHVDENSRELFESFIIKLQATEGFVDANIKKICGGTVALSFVDIIKAYFEVISHLESDKGLASYLETFLRPIQDVSKLYFYLSDHSESYNIEVLSNPKSLHAEYNVTVNFPKAKYLEKPYIGVSKLCCGYCHKSLAEEGYLHRGTHGVCDDKWKMSSEYLEEIFKSSAIAIRAFDQDSLPPQNRRLSLDGFEKIIAFGDNENLYSFKKRMFESEINIFVAGRTVCATYVSSSPDHEIVVIGDKTLSYGTMGFFGVD